MDQIISIITSLFGTLLDYLKTIAATLGLDGYLDSLLGALGLGEESTDPADDPEGV